MSGKLSTVKTVALPEEAIKSLFGPYDENIKQLESLIPVRVNLRGNELTIEGEAADVQVVELILGDYAALLKEGQRMSNDELKSAFKQIAEDRAYRLRDYFTKARINPAGKKQVVAKSLNQRRYMEAIEKNDVVFGIGVAGTGKTFLAVALAVQALMQKRVNRIILARPAVEAGEKLGFLPGDLQDKVDPYLRPLYDALFDLVDYERVTKLLEKRVIEVAPLAFMRGRAQTLDSLLMTPTGWRKMGDVEVGDLVIGSNGKPVEVTGVFPQGKKTVYRLTMTDGSSAVACEEHLWQVKTMEDKRRNRAPRVVETQEMLGNFRRHHQYRYELPVLSAPVEWEEKNVPIDPYALGLMLGDGCISDKTSPSFTTSDRELVSSLGFALSGMNFHFRRKSEIDYMIVNPLAGKGGNKFAPIRNPLTEALRQLQLSGTYSFTKFIPKDYLYNRAEVRIALLQGLLDTDGGPVTQSGRTCRIQYTTTSERLKDDVVFLVRSLGGVAHWRKREAEGRKPGFANGRPVPYRNDAYVLDIRLPEQIKPFRLQRKAEIYETLGGGRPMRFIKNIELVGKQETQCISVDAADSLYVTDDFILTHNTLGEAFIILDEAQNSTPEQMKMFLTRIGFGSKAVITGDVTQIDLPGGKRSGLIEAQRILKGIEDIEFIYFNEKDVVRHRLVQMIIQAYEKNTKTNFEEKL
jgi:phosphate starvation-inducible protein PhoH and related proteins